MTDYDSARRDLPGLILAIKNGRSELIENGVVVLAEPAREQALTLLASAIAQPIPGDLVKLLQMHDGECGSLGLLTDESHLMSAREISSEYLAWLRYAEDEHENEAYFEE